MLKLSDPTRNPKGAMERRVRRYVACRLLNICYKLLKPCQDRDFYKGKGTRTFFETHAGSINREANMN